MANKKYVRTVGNCDYCDKKYLHNQVPIIFINSERKIMAKFCSNQCRNKFVYNLQKNKQITDFL